MTTYNAPGSYPLPISKGGTGNTTGSLNVKGYYSGAVPKWVNSRQAQVASYNVSNDAGTAMLGSDTPTTLDVTQLNGAGNVLAGSVLAGALQINRNQITGSGTSFTSAFQIGDIINLPDFKQSRKITAIASDTELTTDSGDPFAYREWQSFGATISTAQAKFGSSSLYTSSSANFANVISFETANTLHSAENTIEFWFYPVGVSGNQTLLSSPNGDGRISVSIYSGIMNYYLSSTGAGWDIATNQSGTRTITAGQWHHIALVAQNGTLTSYINGQVDASWTTAAGLCAEAMMVQRLGYNGNNTNIFTGYFDAYRISACARYVGATFTPPTSAFTADYLTIALNHFEGTNGSTNLNPGELARPTSTHWDAGSGSPVISTAQSKFGGSSFLASNSNVVLNTGATYGAAPSVFCVECWLYSTSTGANQTLWESSTTGSTLFVGVNTGAKLYFGVGNNGGGSVNLGNPVGPTSIALNTWHHVALSFDGSTYRLFLNGTQEATLATSSLPNAGWARQFKLGTGIANNVPLVGNLDVFRFSKVARYTANFTAPTSAFTTDADTIALNQFDGANGSTNFQRSEAANAGVSYLRGGLARQTHYYPYAITNGSATQLALSSRCKSAGETVVDLPSGYGVGRQLRFALSTNVRGNVPRFTYAHNQLLFSQIDDSNTGLIAFNGDYVLLSNGKATTFSTLSAATLIPKISKVGCISCYSYNDQNVQMAVKVRVPGDGAPASGMTAAMNSLTNSAMVNDVLMPLNESQQFDYRLGNGAGGSINCGFLAKGYQVTEV